MVVVAVEAVLKRATLAAAGGGVGAAGDSVAAAAAEIGECGVRSAECGMGEGSGAATAVAKDVGGSACSAAALNCRREALGGNKSLGLPAVWGVLAGGWKGNSPRQLGQAMTCPVNATDVAI